MMTTLSGKWVFDFNIFIYFLVNSSPFFEQAKELFLKVVSGEIKGYCGHQNIVEAERILIQRYKLKATDVISEITEVIKNFSFQVLTQFPYTLKTFHSHLPLIMKG